RIPLHACPPLPLAGEGRVRALRADRSDRCRVALRLLLTRRVARVGLSRQGGGASAGSSVNAPCALSRSCLRETRARGSGPLGQAFDVVQAFPAVARLDARGERGD